MAPEVLGLLTALVSGGLIAGLVAVYKARPEKESVIVSSAQTATTILQGLNTSLHAELVQEREKSSRLWRQLQAVREVLRRNNIEWDPESIP